MKNLISVIIPCYNQAQYLTESLQSILDQTYNNWECIIINDGSTDNTEEIALHWCKKDKRFKYFKKENGGLSNARNDGIKIAKGEYILPLDSDDKISSKYIEEAAKILDGNDEIGIVYCNAEFFGEKTGKWDLPNFSEEEILFRNIIFCSAVFRKCDYLETRGYNPNMIFGWEDWDFWLSFIENGKRVFKLPDVHFFYRFKKNNSMSKELIASIEKQRYTLKTIYINHFDFYTNRIGHPFELYSKFNDIRLSKDYKIGKLVLEPFRFFKKLYLSFLE